MATAFVRPAIYCHSLVATDHARTRTAVLTVSTGANVMIRRGNGPPEAVLTASDLASINARLATLETLASQ